MGGRCLAKIIERKSKYIIKKKFNKFYDDRCHVAQNFTQEGKYKCKFFGARELAYINLHSTHGYRLQFLFTTVVNFFLWSIDFLLVAV